MTCWFALLAACHVGEWTLAEVTAPLWGTVLAGSVVALGAATVAATLDAWDGHCLRRAERKAGIRR